MKIYCDGSGWNGKESKYIVTDENGKVISLGNFNTQKTNNEMEYEGIIEALLIADDGDEIYSDSQLVVNQLTKDWKINYKHLKKLNDIAKQYMLIKNVKIIWIPREQNLAGKLFD